jgi:flavin-dependent thymidylate synthase
MKVELIDYTGKESVDPYYAARLLVYTKNTRLTQGADGRATVAAMPVDELMKELDYISKTIRSSWEFVDYTFEIADVTRAFTHQFVRTRTGSYAQQSQRSVSMSGFTTEKPATVENEVALSVLWDEHMRRVQHLYSFYEQRGVPAQDARGILPTATHTNIIAKFNLRTLADLLAKRKNLRAQGEYADVAAEMERAVLWHHPWAKPFLDPERLQTPALEALLKAALGTATPFSQPGINAALKELDALKATWG